MDVRSQYLSGYPGEMLDIPWELDEDDDAPHDDIRLRGPESLKAAMERMAAIQSVALKQFLGRRKGMSANRLWLSIAMGFKLAFEKTFGPLPDPSDELAVRHYAERVAHAMKASAKTKKRK